VAFKEALSAKKRLLEDARKYQFFKRDAGESYTLTCIMLHEQFQYMHSACLYMSMLAANNSGSSKVGH